MMKSVVAKRMRLNNSSSSYSRGIRTELDKYLAEECEDEVKVFDILAWWKGQSSRFPILSRLARDVLAIPISIVASESAFSTSGRCWGPSASEGPQKYDLTMFLEYNM
jgi:hypothetical protein